METQGGVTENQETHIFLDPQQSRHFTEYWMPARELDGVTRANLNAVLYFGRNASGALNLQLNASQSFPNVTIKILNGSNAVYSSTANLSPSATFSYSLPNPSPSLAYTVKVLDSSGNLLISHTEGPYNTLSPSAVTLGNQPVPDLTKSDTDQQVLAHADYEERLQQYVAAESDYQLGVAKFWR